MSGSVSHIGTVIGVHGQAWAESADGMRPLEQDGVVYEGEKIHTGHDSNVEIRFLDDTLLSQGSDSTLSLDDYVYDSSHQNDSNLDFGLLKGAFRHVSGKIAETNPENVRLESPLAVIGIRGTVTVHNVGDGEGGETHGVESISLGHRVIIQDDFGEIRIISLPMVKIEMRPDTPMEFIEPLTPQDLEFFHSFAPGALEFSGAVEGAGEGDDPLIGGGLEAQSGDGGPGGDTGAGENAATGGTAGSGADAGQAEGTQAAPEASDSGTGEDDGSSTGGDDPQSPDSVQTAFAVIPYEDLSEDSPGVEGQADVEGWSFDALGLAPSAGSTLLAAPAPLEDSDALGPVSDEFSYFGEESDTFYFGEASDAVVTPDTTISLQSPVYWEHMDSGGYPDYSWLPSGYQAVGGSESGDVIEANVSPGGSGPFALFGFGGDDWLEAAADHMFYGGAGNDTIVAGAGSNSIYGGSGNDEIRSNGPGYAADDLVDGGEGTDTLALQAGDVAQNVFASDARLTGVENIRIEGSATGVSLSGQTEGFLVDGSAQALSLHIVGGAGSDTLIGSSSAGSTLEGGGGSDSLVGGAGDDVFLAGAGDTVVGGGGSDELRSPDASLNLLASTSVSGIERVELSGVGATLIVRGDNILTNAADDPLSLATYALVVSGDAGDLVRFSGDTWQWSLDGEGVSIGDGLHYDVYGATKAGEAATLRLYVQQEMSTDSDLNDAPVVSGPASLGAMNEDGSFSLTKTALLLNATDVDGDTLAVTGVTLASGSGGVVDNGNDTWTFTPTAEWSGTASFNYTVSDGHGGEATTSANLTVNAVNDAPTVSGAVDLGSLNEDVSLTFFAADLLANASDVEGEALSVTGLSVASGSGALQDWGSGSWTFTPDADWSGNVTLAYTIQDASGGTVSTSASLVVNPVNDIPVASNDVDEIFEDTVSVAGNVLSNDTDVDADNLGVVGFVTGAADDGDLETPATDGTIVGAYGTLVWTSETGAYTYSLDNGNAAVQALGAGETLSDTFTYEVADGNGGIDTATLTVTIQGANDAPSVVANSTLQVVGTTETTITNASLQASDPDDTAAGLSYTVTQAPSLGGLFFDGVAITDFSGPVFSQADIDAGRVSYRFDSSAPGESIRVLEDDSFQFTVSDGTATTTAAVFNIHDTDGTVQVLGTDLDDDLTAVTDFSRAGTTFQVYGYDGDDALRGGSGHDTLQGGLGADSFFYTSPLELAGDSIDGTLEKGTWDLIRIDAAAAGQTYDFVSASILNVDGIQVMSDVAGLSLVLGSQIAGTADFEMDETQGDFFVFFDDGSAVSADMANGLTVDGSALSSTQHLYFEGEGGWYDGHYYGRFDGDDTILGGQGYDELQSGSGDDSMSTGDGNDTLRGGDGADTLTGGADQDFFEYTEATQSNTANGVDTITDFSTGVDVLWFEGVSEKSTFVWRDTDAFSVGDFAQARFDTGSNMLQVDADGDGVEDMRFHLSNAPTLHQSDFVWIASVPDDTPANWETLTYASLLGGGTPNYAWFTDQGFQILAGDDSADSTFGSGAENHAVFGYDGNDSLVVNTSVADNYCYGGAGDDSVVGGSGSDTIYGGTGSDMVSGAAGNDVIYGGDQADSLVGGEGVDTLYGGAGNDTISQDGYDAVYGEGDDDHITFTTLQAGAVIDGGTGNDVMDGQGDISAGTILGIEELRVTGNESITLTAAQLASFPSLTTFGTAYLIAASAGTYDLTSLTVTGNFNLYGTTGDDVLKGTSGTASISGGGGNDALYAGSTSASLVGGAGNDTLVGADGDDTLYGYGGTDSLLGGAGNDTIAQYGQDEVYGEGGDDYITFGGTLQAGAVIDGGTGNDVMDGQGDISAGTILGIEELRVTGNESITLTAAQLASFPSLTTFGTAYLIAASAGTYDLTSLTVTGNFNLYGTTGDDVLKGTTGTASISGGGGNDYVSGSVGDDDIYGGTGNDTLYGLSGNDSIEGGDGDDILAGYAGSDTLTGGLGADRFMYLYSEALTGDVIDGTSELETWDLIRVNAQLDDQTFDFTTADSIQNIDGIHVMSDVAGLSLVLGSQIAGTADFWKDGHGTIGEFIVLFDSNSDPNLPMANGISIDGSGLTADQSLTFDGNPFESGGSYYGGFGGDDTVTGGLGTDYLTGGAGSDSLVGGLGGDRFYVSSPGDLVDDSIDGVVERDTLDRIRIKDQSAGQEFDFRDMTSVQYIDRIDIVDDVAGTRLVLGSEIAATADDNMDGVLGDIRVDFRDEIGANSGPMTQAVYVDGSELLDTQSLRFEGEGYVLDGQIYAGFQGNDTVLGGLGEDRLDGGLGADSLVGGLGNDMLMGGDGNDKISGGEGSDTLHGGSGDDSIDGGEGNDLFTGGLGADSLYGGVGEDKFVYYNHNEVTGDVVVAGDASGEQDKVIIEPNGENQIYDFTTASISGIEKVSIEADWIGTMIYLGGNLGSVVDYNGDGISDVKVLYNDIATTISSKVEGVFVDASGFDATQGLIFNGDGGFDSDSGSVFGQCWGSDTVYGGAGNDEIHVNDGDNLVYGGGGNDTINGTDGNHTFYGQDGNDSIVGYDGTDVLDGGNGNDTLTGGEGADTITGGLGADSLVGGLGGDRFWIYSPDSLTGDSIEGTEEQGTWDRLVIAAQSTGQTFDLGAATSILHIDLIDIDSDFAGTTLVLGSQIAATGNYNRDDVFGDIRVAYRGGSNPPVAMVNGIFVDGSALGGGQSLFFEGEGYQEGGVSYAGFAGDDSVLGGLGDDLLEGGAGNDTLDAGPGDDTLRGGVGDDSLYGYAGADILDGGDGNDTLEGAEGAQTLTGGLGNDVFAFWTVQSSNTSDGVDTITDFASGQDTLRLQDLSEKTTFIYRGTDGFAVGDFAQARFDAGSSMLQIDADGDGLEDMRIYLSNAPTLVQDDFRWTATDQNPWLSLTDNTRTYFYDSTQGEYGSYYAFAALREDGSVVTWGNATYGGNSGSVAEQIDGTTDVVQIYGNHEAFAAIRVDGSVVTWGNANGGGDSNVVADQLDGTTAVTDIFSTWNAFAALRADGSVITWGNSSNGGSSSSVAAQLVGSVDVVQIFSSIHAFAALRADGSVVTWGNTSAGGDSSSVASQLDGTIDVVQIAWTTGACAALRTDGSVVTWGIASDGGDSTSVAGEIDGSNAVQYIIASDRAFAALRADGSVVTWGSSAHGGDSSVVADQIDGATDVVEVYAAAWSFAALRVDGSVVTWGDAGKGGDSSSVAAQLDGSIDVVEIFWNGWAFAALRADGSVVTWGDSVTGGDSSAVAAQLDGTVDVVQVFSTSEAFAALRADGSVVTWGKATSGGDSSSVAADLDGSVDVLQVFGTAYSFAALRDDGSLVTWGNAAYGGDSSAVSGSLNDVVWVASPFTDDVYTAPDNPDNWETTSSGGYSNYEWLPDGYVTVVGVDSGENLIPVGGPFAIFGYGGYDWIDASGGNGDDIIFGGAGEDTINGGLGADTMTGGSGADFFVISSPAEIVNDVIDGTSEQGTLDFLFIGANAENQTFDLSTASIQHIDVIAIGADVAGTRIVLGSQIVATADVEQDMSMEPPGEGELTVLYYDGNPDTTHMSNGIFIDGSDLTETQSLFFEGPGGAYGGSVGFEGNDTVLGGQGADDLLGGIGNDSIDAGGGNDELTGGAGADILTGGDGADVFYYSAVSDSNAIDGMDQITDFAAVDDDFHFWSGLLTGTFNYKGTNSFVNDGNAQARLELVDTYSILHVDVNGDTTSDMDIRLDGVASLTIDDFHVV